MGQNNGYNGKLNFKKKRKKVLKYPNSQLEIFDPQFFDIFFFLTQSEPLNLISLHNRVSLSYGISPSTLVIEITIMSLTRVPMGPTEGAPALALEPHQPNLLIAAHAPVRCLRRRLRSRLRHS